jgi:hypothetical protein
MLQAEVENPDSAGFLFDGFQEHFRKQKRWMCFGSKSESITATTLEADDEILVARLLDRRSDILTIKTKKK